MKKKSWGEIKSLEGKEIKRSLRFKERSLYSIKKDPIAYIIRDTQTGKYLLDNPEGIGYDTKYSDDAWWGDTIDDASVFTDFSEASYALEDVNADFGETKNEYSADMDRFCINAVYSEDIFVKDSPIMGYRESKKFREDYAQDRKELDYLRTRYYVKDDKRDDLIASKKEKLKECFDRLGVVLDELFEPFGFYTKDSRYSRSDDGEKNLCFKKDGKEYILRTFSLYRTFYDRDVNSSSRYESFRNTVLRDVVSRVMDSLRNKDTYYPLLEEDFTSYEEGLAKLKQLAKDFAARVKPIFDEAENLVKVSAKIMSSGFPQSSELYDTRARARKSYLKENPIAPGMVVIWNLQNGDVQDVEVISVDDATETAKIKTDGGAVRKVPLDRLEVDTVRAGIDERYW